MTNEIVPQVFENSEFGQLRVARGEDGEPMLVASDVAKVLGYRDAEKLTRLLDEDEKGTQILGTPSGGSQTVSTITESGFYRAVMTRRSKFVKDDEARRRVVAFQRWVTHDVLPAIRRDGAYVASDGTEDDATLMARALVAANRQIERNAARIAALAPKAGMFDACMSGERWQSFTEVARLLHQYDKSMTRKRLFELAMDDGVITRDKQASKYGIDRGYVANYQAPAYFDKTTGEQVRPKPYAKVTSKGVSWMLGRYCKGGDVA